MEIITLLIAIFFALVPLVLLSQIKWLLRGIKKELETYHAHRNEETNRCLKS